MRYCAIVQRLGSSGFELFSQLVTPTSARVVGRLFSQQPPWSIEICMITDADRMPTTIARVTSLGVIPPGTSTARRA